MFPSTAKTDEHSPVGQKYDGNIFHVMSLRSTKQPKADMFYFTAKHPINQHSFVMSANTFRICYSKSSASIYLHFSLSYQLPNVFFFSHFVHKSHLPLQYIYNPPFTPTHIHTVSILTITVQSPWPYLLKHLTCAVHMMYYTPR